MKRFSLRNFLIDTQGVTAIEYALLASLIAMVVLTGIVSVGDAVNDLWQGVATSVINAISS